jgi:DNA helicase HerA-like ATPase
MQDSILIGWADGPQVLRLDRANRHGLVAGATGTGKTVTLQILAQGFAEHGVPVFAADVKGDLSGIALPGQPSEKFLARARTMNLDLQPAAAPAIFWDVFGAAGHPVRATISEMGPLLFARILGLNDVQEGVLTIVFHVADKDGLLLLDLKDLQAALRYVGENASAIGTQYGNVAPATVGAIQRALLGLERQGATLFFGEPALRLEDLMRCDAAGRGYVSVLAADRLVQSPALYATFLLWLLSELFEQLPEIGDVAKPKLVFFFDEAHLLFRDAPRALLAQIEQVVRLIRSKGVGIFFVTQNPADIPEAVLAQLGNRVQHALRAYTPAEQKGLRAAAASFRPNPAFDTAAAIQELGVGEALVSVLDERGVPTMVQKTLVRPPASRLGPVTLAERIAVVAASPVSGVYDQMIDRESAFELLRDRAGRAAREATAPALPEASVWNAGVETPPVTRRAAPRASTRQSTPEAFANQLARTVATQVGRQLMRGLLGGLKRL